MGGERLEKAGKTSDARNYNSVLKYSLLPEVLTSVLLTAKVPKDLSK